LYSISTAALQTNSLSGTKWIKFNTLIDMALLHEEEEQKIKGIESIQLLKPHKAHATCEFGVVMWNCHLQLCKKNLHGYL